MPCDTWSFIPHTRLPLIHQVRGPSLTHMHKEMVSKSHLGRWQLKQQLLSPATHQPFSKTCFIFLRWGREKNDIKDCNTIRVKEERKGSELLPLIPTYKEAELLLTVLYGSTLRQSYKCSPKRRGFEKVTKDKADELSVCRSLAGKTIQYQLNHITKARS